jgi:hypothetical protein
VESPTRQDGDGSKDRIRTLDGIRSEKFYTHLDNQARFRSRSHRRTPVVCFRKFGRHGSWTQERQDLGNNTSRQFLDDIGLNDLEGDTDCMDILYATVEPYIGKNADYTGQGGGSARNVIETIKSDPYGSQSRCGTRKRSESPSYPVTEG